jgi:hypothetical protein
LTATVKSTILDPTGQRAQVSAHWQPPKGSSPFFGWMGQEGFSTIRVENVQAICPQGNFPDRYVVSLKYGVTMIINGEDALRLMKRMGWLEPGEVKQ